MDNLLCDESWLSDPLIPEPLSNFHHVTHDYDIAVMSPKMDESAVEEAISMDLEKEVRFSIHGDKFTEFLVSNKLTDERLQAVQWLIKTRHRLNLTFETVFAAANCFDRVLYMTNSHQWTMWMVELVAVTSLLVASKFNEVTCPSLQEIQMEGLSHMFHYKTVVEMEVIVLKVLEWRVNSVTSYSFSQIIVFNIGLVDEHKMMNRITDHLLDYLCDLEMLQYPPTVVALTAVWNVIEEEPIVHENFGRLTTLFRQEHKKSFVKCVDMTKSRNVEHWSSGRKVVEVKSFVSLLTRGDVMNMNDYYHSENLSAIFQIIRSDKKRYRENYQDMMGPAKRKTFVTSN